MYLFKLMNSSESIIFKINNSIEIRRLLLHKVWNGCCELFVRCEKSMEAELWSCEADFTVSVGGATYDVRFYYIEDSPVILRILRHEGHI